MKKLLATLLTMLLLSSCGARGPEALPAIEAASEPTTAATEAATERTEPPAEPEESAPGEEDGYEDEEEETEPSVFVPDHALTIEETIEAYFREMYRGYLMTRPVDLTSILWMEEWSVKNSVVYSEMLAMRRRMIRERNYCYVETEAFPYALEYIEASELADRRLDEWADIRPTREGEEFRHFVITGEAGRAYPPFLAVNSQHTIRLLKEDGVWKIALHYFPGSMRKWIRGGMLVMPDEKEMLVDLAREFGPADSGYPDDSGGGTPYDAAAAVDYALRYTEHANPDAYHAGEWLGNCQNFISQCVSAGFGGRMAASWYMGGGGGSLAWENVRYFWDWLMGSGEALGHELRGANALERGDLIQTEGGDYHYQMWGDPPGSFSHCLLVVDEETLLLAQNTPACFTYYSDLVNVESRMVRPVLLG